MTTALPDSIKTLMQSNPIFIDGVHFPVGHRDFRGLSWPNEFRAGIYQKVSEPTLFKMIFGNLEDAQSCAGTLKRHSYPCEIRPPHSEQTECDGEDMGTTKTPYFTLEWVVS